MLTEILYDNLYGTSCVLGSRTNDHKIFELSDSQTLFIDSGYIRKRGVMK